MHTYVVLLRGINVGGKNKIPMADLKKCLGQAGFSNVSTYIASGNVILQSDMTADKIRDTIETLLPKALALDSELIRVLVLSHKQLEEVVARKPQGFGDHPADYYSDVIFLMGIDSDQAMAVFDPREGVDKVWPGKGVIYSQRLGSERTKSRLSKIIGTKPYKSMTIRTWGTTTKLLSLMESQPYSTTESNN